MPLDDEIMVTLDHHGDFRGEVPGARQDASCLLVNFAHCDPDVLKGGNLFARGAGLYQSNEGCRDTDIMKESADECALVSNASFTPYETREMSHCDAVTSEFVHDSLVAGGTKNSGLHSGMEKEFSGASKSEAYDGLIQGPDGEGAAIERALSEAE